MPWERKTVDEKRKEFVARAVMQEESLSALCREYDISRPTGYKWIARYQNGESMCDRPINEILKRNTLISEKASEQHTPWKRFEHDSPNALWQMDYTHT